MILSNTNKFTKFVIDDKGETYCACFPGPLVLSGPTADNSVKLIKLITIAICSAILIPIRKTLS